MKRTLLLGALINFNLAVIAQCTINIFVTDNSATPAEKIYVSGSFNNWIPNSPEYTLKKLSNNKWKICVKKANLGIHEFKFTKGDWASVETNAAGGDIANRKIALKQKEEDVYFEIEAWKDQFKGVEVEEKEHSATDNVKILNDSFYIPQLHCKRRVWIYLPANYYSSSKTYPVLYMHDGQNLFDNATAAFGEWRVDETLDSIQKATKKYAIVVGIDHGNQQRLIEYNPYFSLDFGEGNGEAYTAFIVKTLKPFIDKKFRTKRTAKYTAVAGSSMGGLISTFMHVKHPEVFGTSGIFSPAYWVSPNIFKLVNNTNITKFKPRVWLYEGGQESATRRKETIKMYNLLSSYYPEKNIEYVLDPAGRHNEAAWAKWFPNFYSWWTNKW
jgi:predicted alpha/beta superfamily hydrolase